MWALPKAGVRVQGCKRSPMQRISRCVAVNRTLLSAFLAVAGVASSGCAAGEMPRAAATSQAGAGFGVLRAQARFAVEVASLAAPPARDPAQASEGASFMAQHLAAA